jgi:hypothetical protein
MEYGTRPYHILRSCMFPHGIFFLSLRTPLACLLACIPINIILTVAAYQVQINLSINRANSNLDHVI